MRLGCVSAVWWRCDPLSDCRRAIIGAAAARRRCVFLLGAQRLKKPLWTGVVLAVIGLHAYCRWLQSRFGYLRAELRAGVLRPSRTFAGEGAGVGWFLPLGTVIAITFLVGHRRGFRASVPAGHCRMDVRFDAAPTTAARCAGWRWREMPIRNCSEMSPENPG